MLICWVIRSCGFLHENLAVLVEHFLPVLRVFLEIILVACSLNLSENCGLYWDVCTFLKLWLLCSRTNFLLTCCLLAFVCSARSTFDKAIWLTSLTTINFDPTHLVVRAETVRSEKLSSQVQSKCTITVKSVLKLVVNSWLECEGLCALFHLWCTRLKIHVYGCWTRYSFLLFKYCLSTSEWTMFHLWQSVVEGQHFWSMTQAGVPTL